MGESRRIAEICVMDKKSCISLYELLTQDLKFGKQCFICVASSALAKRWLAPVESRRTARPEGGRWAEVGGGRRLGPETDEGIRLPDFRPSPAEGSASRGWSGVAERSF